MQIRLGRLVQYCHFALVAAAIWLSCAVASFGTMKWLVQIGDEVDEILQCLLPLRSAEGLIGNDLAKYLDAFHDTIAVLAIAVRVILARFNRNIDIVPRSGGLHLISHII